VTVRTLVIGIPLPHVSFDNYSFISAPAFSDYQRLIVDMSSASTMIEEVVAGAQEHRDFAGHAVRNAPSTAAAFSLQQLLEMRRRESDWFFAHGGILVCFAHPDVAHPGVEGLCGWRRYSWLPAPQDFRYEQHLLPGFGTPGAEVTDADHPFAPVVAELAPRLAYRVTIDETAPNFSDYGRVFARRTSGGAAIAAELALGNGRLILLPPLLKLEPDRASVAQALFTSLELFPLDAAAS
jgi:hypothetical protein